MACGFFRTMGATGLWLILTTTAFAQAQSPAARFDISGYAVEGAPLLSAEDFSRIVSPFIGKQKTAADVQKAQQALQQAYLDLGHCSVQVTVPKVEPEAGTVTLKLVQSPVPVSKDCLPMVVLDEKRVAPIPVAPGEVAVRPFTDVTQAAAETPPQSETPAQIARAPLKPLQDRPSAVAQSTPPSDAPVQGARAPLKPLQDRPPSSVPAPTPPSEPQIAVAAAPPDAPADVAVKSLAQAPPQPGLIVTPTAPVPVEKPVAATPVPPVVIATAPPVSPPTSTPEVTLAPPPLTAAPTVVTPVVPSVVLEPVKPEAVAVVPAPLSPAPVSTPAPSVTVVEPIKPVPPAPVIAATPQPESIAVPKPQPVIEPAKEQIAAKPDIAPAPAMPPSTAESPIEKPAPEVIAAAPITPEPVRAEAAPITPVAPVVTPEPIATPRIVEASPTVAVEPVKEQVAAKAESEPVATPSMMAEKPAEKPAPDEVVVRPFTGAVETRPEPREPAELKPEVERAPVRPLQDRPSAPAPRVADVTEPTKPLTKPPSVVVQAPAVPAPTEPAPPADATVTAAALKFDIDRYLVEGNTLLNAEAIGKVLSSYTGKQKDFADVQRALESLQIAYQKAGWGAVQVTLPEQELERGEVRFEVIETRIGKIEVQGNEHYSEANVRRSVPSLKPGETPNSLAIARSLKVANENPAKQSQVLLKAGSKDGEVDATIKVVDDNPRKYSVSLDNTGTANTGQLRLGFGFQNSNLWDRDHQLTFQYITNPDHLNKVTVLGLGYHAPLYACGDSVDVIVGYSDVDSGTVQQLFNVSGAGLIALGRYNHNLRRIDDYEHKITFGIDYKAFQNKVTIGGTALVPDITLHPVSVSYSGELRKDQTALNFYASLTYNPLEGGNDAAQSDFRASRGSGGGASAEYVIWRYGVNYQRLLPDDWTFRFSGNAQTTNNALVAGEQFGLGGANSVRGFNERVYSNDRGHQATVEVYTPDIAGKIGFEGGRLKLLAFYDTGTLRRNFLQVGEQTGLSVDSIGLGLRMTFREKFNLRMDYAQVLHDGGIDAGIRDGRRNSNTLHASASFVY